MTRAEFAVSVMERDITRNYIVSYVPRSRAMEPGMYVLVPMAVRRKDSPQATVDFHVPDSMYIMSTLLTGSDCVPAGTRDLFGTFY